MNRGLSRFLSVLACGAAMLAPNLSSAATNLLANPGFEDTGGSYDGWFTFGSGVQISTAANDNIFQSGAAASKVFGEFTACPLEVFDVGGYGQLFTPTAGQEYTFSGSTFVADVDPMLGSDTCNSNRLIAKIVFFDAAVNGAEIQANELIIASSASPTEQWNPFTLSAVAPAGALRVESLILYLQPGCDTGAAFVDDLSFCEDTPTVPAGNLLANPSFDTGVTPAWSIFGNVFSEARSFGLRSAPGAAKLFSTFVTDAPSGMFQSFAASPGEQFELNAFSMTTCVEDPIYLANDNYATARIVFRDSIGDEIPVVGNEEILTDAASPLGNWTQTSVSATAPAGTVTVEAFILFISPTLMGGAVFVDDVYFGAPLATATPPTVLDARLEQNYPNPFNPSTQIQFNLSRDQQVELSVYDTAGRKVVTLLDENRGAGSHSITWNGRSQRDMPVATGVYRYVLRTESGQISRTMVLIK